MKSFGRCCRCRLVGRCCNDVVMLVLVPEVIAPVCHQCVSRHKQNAGTLAMMVVDLFGVCWEIGSVVC